MDERFKIHIVEQGRRFGGLIKIENDVLFANDSKLFKLDHNMVLNHMLNIGYNNVFAISSEGVWVWDELTEGNKRLATFIDLFDNNNKYKNIKGVQGNGEVYGGWYVVDDISKGNFLVSVNFKEGSINRLECNFDIGSFAFKDYIYIRDFGNSLYCFDKQLKQKWSIELPEEANSRDSGISPTAFEKPIVTDDCVLINTGYLYNTKNEGAAVYAYSLGEGKHIWDYSFKVIPDSYITVNKNYYFNQKGQMVVIDTSNGEVLVDQPSGFENNIILYPFQDNLLCFSEKENIIKVFDSSGTELLQEIQMPEIYSPIRIMENICDDDRVFVTGVRTDPLMFAAGYAIIVVEPNSDKGPVVNMEPRIEMKLTETEENGEKEYIISTDNDNLEKIIRYGEIKLRETANIYGYEFIGKIYRKTTDKTHKGKLVFQVDAGRLPEGGVDEIRKMANELEKMLESLSLFPGAGSDYRFKIDVRTK